ncbi:hypothetical protein LCGC14_0771710 [marine sediment metagenome]|uniref:Uncharacterized protein n=1 Tax=marine sediment metagenome TaxID=412755 RepID=A0A0F9T4Z8_9ZZZZ
MAKMTAEEFQEKHARRLKAATADMEKGVRGVTVAPTLKAAQAMTKLRTNLLKAIDSGKMERRLKAVTLQEWQQKMIDKGIGRVASGIDGAKEKTIAFAAQLLPAIDKAKAQIERLPSVTLDDNINRMVTFVREMSKFEKK